MTSTPHAVPNFVQKAYHLLTVLHLSLRSSSTATSFIGFLMDNPSKSVSLSSSRKKFSPNTSVIGTCTASFDRYSLQHVAEYAWISEMSKIAEEADIFPSLFLERSLGTARLSKEKDKAAKRRGIEQSFKNVL